MIRPQATQALMPFLKPTAAWSLDTAMLYTADRQRTQDPPTVG